MRKILIASLFILATGSFFSAHAQSNKSLVGDWEFSVPQAPYGYNKGVISFIEKEKILSGEITLDSGNKIKTEHVSLKDDTLRVGAYVESVYVNILTLVKDNKMEGTVDSSLGKMNFTAEKSASAVKK